MVIYFWRPTESYGCLSNWSAHPITTENGETFPTAEHYFMYEKAMTMGDRATAKRIQRAKTPVEAKRLGRSIRPWNESKWNRVKEAIMCKALTLKVQQYPDIKKVLQDTGDALLAEASPFDRIWGIGCS